MSEPFDNPWTVLAATPQYDNPWIAVTEHRVLNPAGQPGIYGTVHFKNLATSVVPIDADGSTWLVGQYRFPLQAYSWEVPEGGGPLEGDPRATAARELAEETGLRAAGWREILRLDMSNSVCDERAVGFLAWDLQPGATAPEEDEVLALRRLPFAEAVTMALRGEITDALSVASLLAVEALARRGELPPPVAAALTP